MVASPTWYRTRGMVSISLASTACDAMSSAGDFATCCEAPHPGLHPGPANAEETEIRHTNATATIIPFFMVRYS